MPNAWPVKFALIQPASSQPDTNSIVHQHFHSIGTPVCEQISTVRLRRTEHCNHPRQGGGGARAPHLFVVSSSLGGVYQEYIPSLLSYGCILYALKPTGYDRESKSASIRYGVKVEDQVIDSFQTHKGRHRQTHTLFRAGLAARIVNKRMGRTDPR